MSDKNTCLNIPGVSVDELISQLVTLFSCAVKKGYPFKNLPAPFLWGAPGIGKSQAVRQIADMLEVEHGVHVNVCDVRLLLFSPVDLRGVPVADNERRFTKWLMPEIFKMSEDSDTVNILFLDELSAAPQSVQAAAYQICLDRKIGEHILPDNCIVIAAGNRTTDQSVSYKMPKALCNRLMHFDVKPDYESWRRWAVRKHISDKIIAYIGFDMSRLCMEPDVSDIAYPTPRSWEFVSKLLNVSDASPESIHRLIAACVGNDTAIEFEAFCKGYMNMPSVEAILNGMCNEYPRSFDIMYALVSSLTAAVQSRKDSITQEQLSNVCDYIMKLPNDFIVAFMKDIVLIKGINEKLMKCYIFQDWLAKNRDMIKF